jgi:hypothetical protein
MECTPDKGQARVHKVFLHQLELVEGTLHHRTTTTAPALLAVVQALGTLTAASMLRRRLPSRQGDGPASLRHHRIVTVAVGLSAPTRDVTAAFKKQDTGCNERRPMHTFSINISNNDPKT